MIRGYHKYVSIWVNPVIKEDISCKREIGNTHDTHAVAAHKIINGEIKTIGHALQKTSTICSFLLGEVVQFCALLNHHLQKSQSLIMKGL